MSVEERAAELNSLAEKIKGSFVRFNFAKYAMFQAFSIFSCSLSLLVKISGIFSIIGLIFRYPNPLPNILVAAINEGKSIFSIAVRIPL